MRARWPAFILPQALGKVNFPETFPGCVSVSCLILTGLKLLLDHADVLSSLQHLQRENQIAISPRS